MYFPSFILQIRRFALIKELPDEHSGWNSVELRFHRFMSVPLLFARKEMNMRSKRVAALAALVFGFSVGTLWAEDKIPSIEDIMGNQHAKDGTLDKITAAAKQDKPDWDKIQDWSKEYVKEISLVGKNKMPEGKGTAQQWKEWTKQLADSAKNLDEQAKKKDKEGLTKAIAKIKPDQCMRCHDKFKD